MCWSLLVSNAAVDLMATYYCRRKPNKCLMCPLLELLPVVLAKKWLHMPIPVMNHEHYCSTLIGCCALLRMASLQQRFGLVHNHCTLVDNTMFSSIGHLRAVFLRSKWSMQLLCLLLQIYHQLHKSPNMTYNPDVRREHPCLHNKYIPTWISERGLL